MADLFGCARSSSCSASEPLLGRRGEEFPPHDNPLKSGHGTFDAVGEVFEVFFKHVCTYFTPLAFPMATISSVAMQYPLNIGTFSFTLEKSDSFRCLPKRFSKHLKHSSTKRRRFFLSL
jgi:hypothetical protein